MKSLVISIRFNIATAMMLHVDHMFLYPSSDGQCEDGDFYDFSSRPYPVTMRRSPDNRWTRRPNLPPRDSHRAPSFEHFPRPRSPWQSRPRSPVRPELPVQQRPLSMLSMGPVSNPLDASERRQYADKRQPSESFYSDNRAWQSVFAERHFSNATADFVPKHSLPAQSADSKYQQPPRYMPGNPQTYRQHDRAVHSSVSSALDAKLPESFSKLMRGKLRQAKWIGARRSTEGRLNKPTTTRLDHRTSLSRVKKRGSTLAGRSDRPPLKTSSVPHAAAESVQAAQPSQQTPARPQTSDESAAAIRPEDIIIIRRYNVDGSTAERKPESSGGQSRHVVRLVRNNVMSPLAAASDLNVAGGTEERQESVVKKRRWGGVVNMSEGAAATGRVDDTTQPDYNRQ